MELAYGGTEGVLLAYIFDWGCGNAWTKIKLL